MTSKSQGYREGCWSKIIVWLTAWKNLLDSQTHSYNKADFMVSWTKRSCPFLTMPTQKSLKQLLAFLNLYQHLKIWLLDLCILEIQSILESCNQTGHTHFDHTHPKHFWSTFNLCEFVPTCKKSGYSIHFFWRYDWLKNPPIWLAENILIRISRTKIFQKMRFVQKHSK